MIYAVKEIMIILEEYEQYMNDSDLRELINRLTDMKDDHKTFFVPGLPLIELNDAHMENEDDDTVTGS